MLVTRLPVHHPEYRYPPSPNPYWEKLRAAQGQVYLDNQTENHRGNWKSVLSNAAGHPLDELHVELGCNGGHVILEWARLNPSHAYLGLDWKFKQIHRAFEKAQKKGLRNIGFLRAHAIRLGQIFGPSEIDHLHLLFPDPWPKKSQWNNRLITPEWLREAASVVHSGGLFEIRTDHSGYFDWMKAALTQVQDIWQTSSESRDFYAGRANLHALEIPEVTLFERLFIKDGIPIHRLLLRRT